MCSEEFSPLCVVVGRGKFVLCRIGELLYKVDDFVYLCEKGSLWGDVVCCLENVSCEVRCVEDESLEELYSVEEDGVGVWELCHVC